MQGAKIWRECWIFREKKYSWSHKCRVFFVHITCPSLSVTNTHAFVYTGACQSITASKTSVVWPIKSKGTLIKIKLKGGLKQCPVRKLLTGWYPALKILPSCGHSWPQVRFHQNLNGARYQWIQLSQSIWEASKILKSTLGKIFQAFFIWWEI